MQTIVERATLEQDLMKFLTNASHLRYAYTPLYGRSTEQFRVGVIIEIRILVFRVCLYIFVMVFMYDDSCSETTMYPT